MDNSQKSTAPGQTEDTRTAILFKGDMLGMLGLKVTPEGSSVARYDARQKAPIQRSPFDDADAARRGFGNMLRTSKRNGWTVAYVGPQLNG